MERNLRIEKNKGAWTVSTRLRVSKIVKNSNTCPVKSAIIHFSVQSICNKGLAWKVAHLLQHTAETNKYTNSQSVKSPCSALVPLSVYRYTVRVRFICMLCFVPSTHVARARFLHLPYSLVCCSLSFVVVAANMHGGSNTNRFV